MELGAQHADVRNVAFRDGTPIVFDWQQAGFADPAYDVLQLVNEAARQVVRAGFV